ncbi:MAG: hypothetical protein ACXWB0_06920 [Sulfuricurvum sp.]
MLEIKRLHDKEFIDLDKISKERIHTMIRFGEYHDKEAVVKAAIEKLFAQHRKSKIKTAITAI